MLGHEMTPAEITRTLERLEATQAMFITRDYYERDLHEIRGDIREIKEGQRRVVWMIVGMLATMVTQIVVFLVTMQV